MSQISWSISQWAPHPTASPVNECLSDRFVSRANGCEFCCGGWQFSADGIRPGCVYHIECDAVTEAIDDPGEALAMLVYWAHLDAEEHRLGTRVQWDYLCGLPDGRGGVRFRGTFTAPEGNTLLTVRTVFRWRDRGQVSWQIPSVRELGPDGKEKALKIAVATGMEGEAAKYGQTIAGATQYYAALCRQICDMHSPDLIALPEVCLQWHVPGHPVEKTVEIPGPEIERFCEVARQFHTVIVIGTYERKGTAVCNSAVVLDANGELAGIYRKVHLASFEAVSGVVPGDGFPVFRTSAGYVGCNICMDSSACESSRMVGLNGADVLVLPIMGDHRASRWDRGNPYLDEDRWLCIMRTRAMDNQLTMVVARNNAKGSCIVDRSGAVLAYNDGTADSVIAEVAQPGSFRKWNGGCFRQVNWRQRRPGIYDSFVAPYPMALRRLSDQ